MDDHRVIETGRFRDPRQLSTQRTQCPQCRSCSQLRAVLNLGQEIPKVIDQRLLAPHGVPCSPLQDQLRRGRIREATIAPNSGVIVGAPFNLAPKAEAGGSSDDSSRAGAQQAETQDAQTQRD